MLRADPCGIICIFITYSAVFYADYVITWWIVLDCFYDSLWGTFHVLLFNIVIALGSAAHLRAVCSDPGIVPLPQNKIDFSDYHSNNATLRADWSLCTRCESYRPPRAHHCRICKRCVRKMDHHCPWINNCVGEFNQKYFIQFLLYVGVLSVYAIGLVLYTWSFHSSLGNNKEDLVVKQSRILHSVILLLESLLFGLFVTAILIDQLSAIFSEETAVEQIKSRNSHSNPQKTKKPKCQLLGDVCGSQKVFYWFIPCAHNFVPPNEHNNFYLDV